MVKAKLIKSLQKNSRLGKTTIPQHFNFAVQRKKKKEITCMIWNCVFLVTEIIN